MTTAILRSTFQRLTAKRTDRDASVNTDVFGQKIGLITSVFGCWHEDLGRPFMAGKTAYRSCLSCGARRQFDTETFETYGSFYAPSVIE